MYNRYIPGQDGAYRRERVEEPYPPQPTPRMPVASPQDCAQEPPPAPPEAEKQQSLWGMDLGDLLLLCILFLILLESQDEDPLPLLITAAAFFLLR